MKFYKIISESEAYYSFKENKIIESGGAQSSYNLPKKFFMYVKDKILIEDPDFSYVRKETDGDAYILRKDYEFELGSGVLSLIGNRYRNIENKFIASLNGTNGKFQIYRIVYDNLGSEYGWFVKLYDKNLTGNKLILDIDEKNKIFTIDIEFVSVKQEIYTKYINQVPMRI